MNSDTENLQDCPNEYLEDPVDVFMFNQTNNLMDLYYDLRNRLPYFLDKLEFSDLLHFITDINLDLKHHYKPHNPHKLYHFESEYNRELTTCLYIINNHMAIYKKTTIEPDIFLLFAFKFTTLS